MVEELLGEAGVSLAALHAIAFGSGPGSFTGLRIACGVAQGLAFAVGLPVVTVTSLLALAKASGADRVISCLDARMGEVYFAAYRRESEEWRCIQDPGLYQPSAVPMVEGDGWTGVGSGFAVHGAALAARYQGRLLAQRPDVHPSARDIAVLAARRYALGLVLPPEQAVPLYLRDRVALTVDERESLRRATDAAGTL
jgi:tRNA threonylcarbamoyladenosine biosynthesis protein TsaB